MLTVVISLVFAFAAALATFTVLGTIRGQWAGAMDVMAAARDMRAERNFTVRYFAPHCPSENVVDLAAARPAPRRAIMLRATASHAPLRAAA